MRESNLVKCEITEWLDGKFLNVFRDKTKLIITKNKKLLDNGFVNEAEYDSFLASIIKPLRLDNILSVNQSIDGVVCGKGMGKIDYGAEIGQFKVVFFALRDARLQVLPHIKFMEFCKRARIPTPPILKEISHIDKNKPDPNIVKGKTKLRFNDGYKTNTSRKGCVINEVETSHKKFVLSDDYFLIR